MEANTEPKKSSKKTQNWQNWPGKNKFCCQGYCMKTRCQDRPIIFLNYFINIALPIFFFIWPGGYIYFEINKVVPFQGFLFRALALYSLLRATFVDAGVILRKDRQKYEILKHIGEGAYELVPIEERQILQVQNEQDIEILNAQEPHKYIIMQKNIYDDPQPSTFFAILYTKPNPGKTLLNSSQKETVLPAKS